LAADLLQGRRLGSRWSPAAWQPLVHAQGGVAQVDPLGGGRIDVLPVEGGAA